MGPLFDSVVSSVCRDLGIRNTAEVTGLTLAAVHRWRAGDVPPLATLKSRQDPQRESAPGAPTERRL